MRRDIVVQRYFLSRRKKRVINITNVIKLNFKSPSFEIIINRQRKRAFAILTENLKPDYRVSYLLHPKRVYIIPNRSHLLNQKKKKNPLLPISYFTASSSPCQGEAVKAQSPVPERPHGLANDAPRYTEQTFPSRPIRMEYESRG